MDKLKMNIEELSVERFDVDDRKTQDALLHTKVQLTYCDAATKQRPAGLRSRSARSARADRR